jgi:hypothetical protein
MYKFWLSTLFLLPSMAVAADNAAANYNVWQTWLVNAAPWLMPIMLVVGPMIGFSIVTMALLGGLRHLADVQREQVKKIRLNEQSMERREKVVLASALVGELTENKIKGETFITIYSELLRNLRDTTQRAVYEDTGDYIHQFPPLSRSVFDAHVEKLALLGPKLAADTAQVYAAIRGQPEYFKLEPSMPRVSVIRIVEMVLDDAQRTLEPLDTAISGLNIIVRDGQLAYRQ